MGLIIYRVKGHVFPPLPPILQNFSLLSPYLKQKFGEIAKWGNSNILLQLEELQVKN